MSTQSIVTPSLFKTQYVKCQMVNMLVLKSNYLFSEIIIADLCNNEHMSDSEYFCLNELPETNANATYDPYSSTVTYTCPEGYLFIGGVTQGTDTAITRTRNCSACSNMPVQEIGTCKCDVLHIFLVLILKMLFAMLT